MKNIHPKTAFATVAGLAWTAICLALTQYAPHYAPDADLTAAVGTVIAAVASYLGPSGGTP